VKSENKGNKGKSALSRHCEPKTSFSAKQSRAVNSGLRIIDANLNRCREGLRVVEDSLRFVLNDEVLYKKVRRTRHDTDKILRDKYGTLISERDTYRDYGRKMPETSKKNLSAILIANFKRAQEALRVLEEYSKSFKPEAAPQFKKQRYAAYNLEKAVFLKYGKGKL